MKNKKNTWELKIIPNIKKVMFELIKRQSDGK